jgi:hypothetical protein
MAQIQSLLVQSTAETDVGSPHRDTFLQLMLSVVVGCARVASLAVRRCRHGDSKTWWIEQVSTGETLVCRGSQSAHGYTSRS